MSNVILSFAELLTTRQSLAGGKGASLARLSQAGFPVPDGFVIMPDAFIKDELTPQAWSQISSRLQLLRAEDDTLSFAIRSSAMSEDSVQASFAGEFETVLHVQSDKEIRQAIQTVYHSRQNERVQAYSQAKGMSGDHKIAIIVQQMVRAEISGVLFTANPVTGDRDQAMISAAWGLGEAIVGGFVTPDTLIVEKATGEVLSRETAVKEVMTVLLKRGTEEQPVPESLRRNPVLTDAQAADLVRLGVQIEALYGMPMDIEWTLANGQFAIVQARPITALPTPEPPVPSEWKLPPGAYVAMRNNIVELMADPLTPLFRTLGLSAVNASMRRLLAAFFGRPDMTPEELIISVNEYAYYNGSLKAGQMARIFWGSIGIMKRMFSGAVARWIDDGRPRYVATVAEWGAKPWPEMPATELINGARELAEAAVDAYGALVSGLIPAAWISEGLFTAVYKLLIKRRDDPPAPTYLMGFDSLPIRAEKSLYDLAQWVRGQPELAAYLMDTPATEVAGRLKLRGTPAGVAAAGWVEWQTRFRSHLQQYGHTIYNLDFGNPVPADDPTPLLETCKLFIRGQGVNPHVRQQTAVERREQTTQSVVNRLKRGIRLKLFHRFLKTAQRYAPLREDGLADVGLSYPLLRQVLLEAGQRFTKAGVIEQPADIFWLTQNEVEQTAAGLDRNEGVLDLSALIPERRAVWRAARQAEPPLMLPQIKILGKDIAGIKNVRKEKKDGEFLKGVAASPGQVTATACVVNGPEDFSAMKTGDVLVAALTTPAWTPLFARAAAIVTDIGGPLSHGSIVAREYGIPAVLGTGVATKRIHSGQLITVDGTAGQVTLEVAKQNGQTS